LVIYTPLVDRETHPPSRLSGSRSGSWSRWFAVVAAIGVEVAVAVAVAVEVAVEVEVEVEG
jgi:hypothetical protein